MFEICKFVVYAEIPIKDCQLTQSSFKKAEAQAEHDLEHAVDILYPHRPENPIPSTLNTSALAGTYHDDGYGTVQLHEKNHPSNNGETILSAERPEMTFPYIVTFHHVTGNFWVAYYTSTDGQTSPYGFTAAEFVIGSNGKPTGFYMIGEDGKSKIFFTRQ